MNYHDAEMAIHTTATVPDGYNGHFANIGFAFETETGKTLEVADCGVYDSGLPITNNVLESKQIVRQYENERPYVVTNNPPWRYAQAKYAAIVAKNQA